MSKRLQRLITFGDSFTYGDELKNPKESCWPSILANKLQVPLENKAIIGNSNDYIMSQILKEHYTFFDFVIVCFSSVTRLHFEDQAGEFKTIEPIEDLSYSRNNIIKNLNATLSEEWLYRRWIEQAIYIQSFLHSRNVKYFFCSGFGNEDFQKYDTKQNRKLTELINQKCFIGWPNKSFNSMTHDYPRGLFRHPLEESHEIFADIILENLKTIYELPKDY